MNEYELRRRLGMYGVLPDAWYRLRDEYWDADHEPLMLNQGGPAEEPFTVALAIGWAERLCEAAL